MSTDRTLFERATNPHQDEPNDDSEARDPEPHDSSGDIAAKTTTIQGNEYDLADPITGPTFTDTTGHLSGEYGRPRPKIFWTAKQLGQTPAMQLIKDTVTQQLTGGSPEVSDPDGELSSGASDLAELIEDIYRGPHHQNLSFDALITTAVSDLIDTGWAYWEILPTQGGEFPVAGFKPLPPLQIQHTINEDTGDTGSDPAYWRVPFKRRGNSITSDGQAEGLEEERVVSMRAPKSARSDSLYGESIATKVREWLEIIVDVDVHQKRFYSDSQVPKGFFHFTGSVGKDKLKDVEDDIVEAAGDPHDLVTVSTEGEASWIPVGEKVVDLDAIQEQQWYMKLVLAAAGLNMAEIGVVEGSGFAKETPALQRAIFKNVTKPFKNAIMQPQNSEVVPRIRGALSAGVDDRLVLDIRRSDPIHEQIERQETLDEWREGVVSLNEVRGTLGRELAEVEIEVDELDEAVNVADLPKDIVDLLLRSTPEISFGGGGSGNPNSAASSGPPDFEQDPVLSEEEAFQTLGYSPDERIVRQLDDTIEVKSSFIESVAYARPTEFLQLEFERVGKQNAIYWYGNVPEYRFRNIIQASSKGKYFNKYIRGEYTYARLQ